MFYPQHHILWDSKWYILSALLLSLRFLLLSLRFQHVRVVLHVSWEGYSVPLFHSSFIRNKENGMHYLLGSGVT